MEDKQVNLSILDKYINPDERDKNIIECLLEGNIYGAFTTARLFYTQKLSKSTEDFKKTKYLNKIAIIELIENYEYPNLTEALDMEFIGYQDMSDICNLVKEVSKTKPFMAKDILKYAMLKEIMKSKEIEIQQVRKEKPDLLDIDENIIYWYDTIYPEYRYRFCESGLGKLTHELCNQLCYMTNIKTPAEYNPLVNIIDESTSKAQESINERDRQNKINSSLLRHFFPKQVPGQKPDTVHHQKPQAQPQTNPDSNPENPVYFLP